MTSPLLLAECREGEVLETHDLGLEESQVHERRATVVLAFDVVDARTFDPEDRHAPAVRPVDLDTDQLAATGETERSQEQVVRLEHAPPPALAGTPALSQAEIPARTVGQLEGEAGG
jgi:hypothetical protein